MPAVIALGATGTRQKRLLDEARLRDLHRLGGKNLRQRGARRSSGKSGRCPRSASWRRNAMSLSVLRAEPDDATS